MTWTGLRSAYTETYSGTTATTKTWGGVSSAYTVTTADSRLSGLPMTWAQDKPSTYTQYDIGENFVCIADEQQWDFANDDRPIIVPPDSGYSEP